MWMLFPLLFIPPLIALGWTVHYGRGVARGEPGLPPWRFSYVADGFKWFAVTFVYNLPVYVIAIPLYIAMFASFSSPDGVDPGLAGKMLGRQFMVSGLIQFWSLAVSAIHPAIAGILIRNNSFTDCFRPSLIKAAIRPFGANYVIAPLLVLAASFGAAFGILLCCVGLFFTMFYAQTVLFHFGGQMAAALPAAGRPPPSTTLEA